MDKLRQESILDSIMRVRRGHHDTLYVDSNQRTVLRREVTIPSINSSQVTDMTVCGLDVVQLPTGLPAAISCKKGEVFPLAKDWKNGDIAHE